MDKIFILLIGCSTKYEDKIVRNEKIQHEIELAIQCNRWQYDFMYN